MHDSNPYAPPAGGNPFSPSFKPETQVGIWRDGNLLVMAREATLPDICIKSNQPTDGYRLKRKLSWHHPALAILIIISIPIYAIVAVLVSKRATIHVGLSDAWRRRRLRRIWVAWACVLLAFVGGIAGIALAENVREDVGAPLFLASVVLFFGGLLYGMIGARLIRAKRIDDRFVKFSGVHPEYLNRFPEFRAEPFVPQAS